MKTKHYCSIFLLALAARLYILYLHGSHSSGDTPDYLLLAQNLLEHHTFSLNNLAPFTPSIRRPPVYPVFLAITYPFHHYSLSGIAFIQTFLGAVTAALSLRLAAFALPIRYSLLSASLVAIHPGLVTNASTILTEPLFTFLFVVAVVLTALGFLRQNIWLAVGAGFVMGLASLCRPIALPLVLIFALLWWLLSRAWRLPAALVLAFCFTIAPWAMRCSLAAERLVLVQGLGPANFYLSTLHYDGGDETAFWRAFPQDEYGRRLTASRSPAELKAADDFAMAEAIKRIRANPLDYIKDRARRYPYLFLTSFDSVTGFNQSFGQLAAQHQWGKLITKVTLLAIFALLPLGLAIFGAAYGKADLMALLCLSVWAFTLVVHLPMWIEYRFGVPALPFLLLSAVVGIQTIFTPKARQTSVERGIPG